MLEPACYGAPKTMALKRSAARETAWADGLSGRPAQVLAQRQPGERNLEALPVRGIELIETGSLQLTLALIEQGLAQAGVGHEVRVRGYQLLGQRTGLLEQVPIVGEAG